MTKWECCSRLVGKEASARSSVVRNMGAQGWELVTVIHLQDHLEFFFKRLSPAQEGEGQ